MIRAAILAVGKLKERYYRDAFSEYAERLSHYMAFEAAEVPDRPDTLPRGMDMEGEDLLRRIKPDDRVIALCVDGEQAASEDLFDKYLSGDRRAVFLIGGSRGLSDAALGRADSRLSLSKMTLPHQLARVVLAEQLYRAMKIYKNETYHK